MVMHESGPSAAPVDWRNSTLSHVSQLATNCDPKSNSYHIRSPEPGINCETCHGPSGGHVRVLQQAQQEKRNRPPET
jgi:hypothetical protein